MNDISYRAKTGLLIIHPDKSEYSIPPVYYYFYNVDGYTPPVVQRSDDQGNFEGTMPEGSYRVIAANTDASNVLFAGMDSHETAVVRAKTANQSRIPSDIVLLSQPGNVYSVVIANLSVKNKDTLHFEPKPVLLTKNLHISFVLKGELADEVVGIGGVIRGVYPSMHLYTQRYEEAFEGVLSSAVQFEGDQSSQTTGGWGLLLSIFGIADPEGGESYQNILELKLTMEDNSEAITHVDVTEQLTEIIKGNQGEMPLEVKLEIELKKVDIAVMATVIGWDDNTGECETII